MLQTDLEVGVDYRISTGFYITNAPRYFDVQVVSCENRYRTKIGRTYYPEPFTYLKVTNESVLRL